MKGAEGVLTKVTVFQRGASGDVCMKCGQRTSERIRIRRKARNINYRPESSPSADGHPIALLINFVAGKYHHSVDVSVPVCASCKKSPITEPKYIDFERRSMTFVGHRAWKEDIERERSPAESAQAPRKF
jgi:hypothetical protein